MGYSQGHVQDLIGLRLPDPSEQLLKFGHEGDTRAYEDRVPLNEPATSSSPILLS